MVTMTQGADIHWDSIDVVISVNGSAPLLCDGHGESNDDCQLIEFGNTDDEVWSVGDGVTLSENDFDLCHDVCSLDIRIEHTSEGRVIYELTGVLAE